jgi:hypothetical protein
MVVNTCDMLVMIDGGCRKNALSTKETAVGHERIVKEASRLFRERGFENVTVGEVLRGAGLTHGACYATSAQSKNSRKLP